MNPYIPYDIPLLFDTPEQMYAFDKAYAAVMKGTKGPTKTKTKKQKTK